MTDQPTLDRLLRLPAVEAVVGLKRTAIAEMIERGEFPKPVYLSDGGRAKAWLESEVREYVRRRIAARDAGTRPPGRRPSRRRAQ